MEHKKWYIIEGNIGSGKTTLINKLKTIQSCEVIEEPVDVWLSIKDENDKNLLGLFYDDPNKYAYIFQSMVFTSRLKTLDKPQDKLFRFSERSIWTDKYIFGKSCIESGKINHLESHCYNIWFNWLEDKFAPKPDGIIYVKTSPEKCLERIKTRSRSEEDSIPLDYLIDLHKRHDEWLCNWNKTPVLILNNDEDCDDLEKFLDKIKEFSNLNDYTYSNKLSL